MWSYFWSNAQWFEAKDSAHGITWSWIQQPMHLLVQALKSFYGSFRWQCTLSSSSRSKVTHSFKQCAVFPAHLPSLLGFPCLGHSWMAHHEKEEQTKGSTYKNRNTTVMVWSSLYEKVPEDWIAQQHLHQTALLESPCSAQRECCTSAPKIFSSDSHLRSEGSIYLSLMHRVQCGPTPGT